MYYCKRHRDEATEMFEQHSKFIANDITILYKTMSEWNKKIKTIHKIAKIACNTMT